eukprot:CAMPEP_0179152192 /NCGR_PEP_ID=MMETSP0796-20121207/73946_1 /TAXON_ID=73915 /ORGANISM="Pyrodinium bahamense, Strain pbaha01" /LENGTH=184 /DNA_ID=CAMNT_0020853381 /DNA_START=37 /DNA_END=592 /DNA_ORIENTATION=-
MENRLSAQDLAPPSLELFIILLLQGWRVVALLILVAVDVMVGVREERAHELALVHAAAVIVVEALEELQNAFVAEADLHPRQQLPELLAVQLSVRVGVREPEERGDVVRRVSPLAQALAGALHEKDSVAVLPSVRKGVADDADRDGHVQHGDNDQHTRYEGAGGALGGHVPIANRRHCHDGEPD